MILFCAKLRNLFIRDRARKKIHCYKIIFLFCYYFLRFSNVCILKVWIAKNYNFQIFNSLLDYITQIHLESKVVSVTLHLGHLILLLFKKKTFEK